MAPNRSGATGELNRPLRQPARPESGVNRNAHAFGDIHAVNAGFESL